MKSLDALFSVRKRRDTVATEHLEKNRIKATLEGMCSKYLLADGDIFEFEALPKALPYVVDILEERDFLEKYEFMQVSDSLFQVRERPMDLM